MGTRTVSVGVVPTVTQRDVSPNGARVTAAPSGSLWRTTFRENTGQSVRSSESLGRTAAARSASMKAESLAPMSL